LVHRHFGYGSRVDDQQPEANAIPPDDAPTPNLLILPSGAEQALSEPDGHFGALGRPINVRHPFLIGFYGALGVAVAFVIARGIADVAGILVIIGIALFLAIGLNPLVTFLESHAVSRGLAVGIVTFGFLAVVGGFLAAAIPPTTHEVRHLVAAFPTYRREVLTGKGPVGHWVARLHLTHVASKLFKLHLAIGGGLLSAGKAILSFGVGAISVIALTIYFLIAMPGVKRLWLSLIPRSRRHRVELLTEEVFVRVGGFMLGNLLTSGISGVLTFVWLVAFHIPYPLMLALLVAIFDLIPLVGSTLAGAVVCLVALSKGVPIAIGTAAYFVAYRYAEDYFLNPRIMKATVKVTPGVTIIATLLGGALLGLIGALVAIPVAATVRLLIDEVTVPRQNQR